MGARPTAARRSLAGDEARTCEAAFRRALDRYNHNPTGVDLVRLWNDAVELLPTNNDSSGSRRPHWLGTGLWSDA